MMDKRNKLWRRRQMARVFKARLIRLAACSPFNHLHWFQIADEKWVRAYKTTGTPCSCWMCRGEEYDRRRYKKETQRIIRDSLD